MPSPSTYAPDLTRQPYASLTEEGHALARLWVEADQRVYLSWPDLADWPRLRERLDGLGVDYFIVAHQGCATMATMQPPPLLPDGRAIPSVRVPPLQAVAYLGCIAGMPDWEQDGAISAGWAAVVNGEKKSDSEKG